MLGKILLLIQPAFYAERVMINKKGSFFSDPLPTQQRFHQISQVPLRSLAAHMKNSITLSQTSKPLRGGNMLHSVTNDSYLLDLKLLIFFTGKVSFEFSIPTSFCPNTTGKFDSA